MTLRRLALRALAMLAGTLVILAIFGELRWGDAAGVFTGLFIVFFAIDAWAYLRDRK